MTLSTLGIDIAKLKFDVALRTADDKFLHLTFPNTPDGFARLAAWLARREAARVHACLEATGTYGEALAGYLHDAGHTVSVVNPAAIKAFAASRLSRTKTDRVDAELIARYCHTQHPPAWAPPAAEILELQALGRRLEALVEMRTMETNRLAAGVASEAVRGSLQQHLAYLDAEIRRTEKLIGEHIDAHPGLREQRDLLVTIPGIGKATAATLLAEMPDIKAYRSARQAAAFAGLAPRRRESGSSVRGRARLSKIGSPRLRRALYFPAVTALRFNPLVRRWGEGLSERGKCKLVVIGAAMRKLVHLAYGVLKTGKPFDAEWAKAA
jgi:transposase